ncbi:nucleotidyltransferase domain-containing protein [Candidatus Micrarchaeota archaeon]|nr:nucleotidyltransferase domain-containing protein [Candidatus Micrarchaeota archaeon]
MGLIEVLKNPEVRRLFGKRELAIIEKQILGVSLNQSEKNRLSRDIRKKFEAISALSSFSGRDELKKGSEIRRIVEETRQTILESKYRANILRITLFGSAVENTLSLSSDIDISVELEDLDLKQATQFRREALSKTGKRIDIQVYNFLPKKVKREIDSKGRILYERKNN